MTKKKLIPQKELRRPPGSEIPPEIDSWVSGEQRADVKSGQNNAASTAQAPHPPSSQATNAPSAQVPKSSVPQARLITAPEENSKTKQLHVPIKKGIVERSGGRLTRRVVFYLDPDQAEALRRRAFEEGRDMSTIVAQLVDRWLKT